jgi:hypothetical protein
MKIPFNAAVAAALALAALPALATEVGVSVQVSQPGVYGRIDIGRFPQPQVVVAQPVIMVQPRYVAVAPEPIYMWVPPGHQKNWRRHCGRYNACGVPVYFVQDGWYQQNVRGGHGEHSGNGNGKGHGKGHD